MVCNVDRNMQTFQDIWTHPILRKQYFWTKTVTACYVPSLDTLQLLNFLCRTSRTNTSMVSLPCLIMTVGSVSQSNRANLSINKPIKLFESRSWLKCQLMRLVSLFGFFEYAEKLRKVSRVSHLDFVTMHMYCIFWNFLICLFLFV